METKRIEKIEEIDNGYNVEYLYKEKGMYERRVRHCNTKDEVVYEIKELL